MWDLRSRAAIALVTALSGCAFLYNISGPILILAVSLLLTVYACYSLIVNDSFVSPHAFLFFRSCKRVTSQLRANFEPIPGRVYLYVRQIFQAATRRFRNRHLTQSQSAMERRRASHYQLSTDSYPTRRTSSSFPTPNDFNSKDNLCQTSGHSLYDQSSFTVKHTSTPLFPRSREELENQRFKLSPSGRSLPRRTPSMYSQTRSPSQGESSVYFPAESSPWNAYASPKVEEKKAGDRKPVQTVGGPLLTSSRYNIARKVYNDVTSPGLTGRLTKYAEEASNELTRRSQYRVGQFPKVNLHASPVPLLNAKAVKARTPVTVRVAPPRAVRYSPPSKQNVLTGSPYADASCSSPSVAQTLKEMSLKRHASRDDVASDLAKKQRTDGLAGSEFEAQDETKQKRSRDDSLKSDEDSSPQSKTTRPTKRTKTPSCYDIVNSLGSNKHVVSGIKRKAREYCRSATPDFEKHFKSLECVQSPQTPPQVANASSGEGLEISEEAPDSDACSCANKTDEPSPLKGILKGGEKRTEGELDGKQVGAKRANAQRDERDRSRGAGVANEAAKLTHKLFMRAEPERNEKLRMLVEEQGNIRAKFTTDDVEEIKKEDIADMRQTSMKARLQSMFDAISGRTTSGINPDVVIQAEEVPAVQPVECPVTCATLNSSTTTTNVNTTPIFTPAVAPSSASSDPLAKPTKHVAFTLPNKQVTSNASVQLPATFEKKLDTLLVPASTIAQTTSAASANTFSVSASPASTATSSPITATSSSAPPFNFGKLTSSAPGASPLSAHPAFTAPTAKLASPLLAASTTAGIFVKAAPVATATPRAPPSASAAPTRTSVLQAPVTSNTKIETGNGSAISALSSAKPITPIASTGAEKKEQGAGSTFIAGNASVGVPNSSTVTATAASSTPVFSFGNKTTASPAAAPKYDGFVFATTGNATQSSSAFGGSSAPRQTSTTSNGPSAPANSVANVAPAPPSLDSNAKTTASTFGLPASSTFAFRPAPALASSDGKPSFSFGSATPATNTTSATNATTASSSGSLFAVASNTSGANFGAPPSTGSGTQFASNPGSIFANSVSAPSIFGATATTSNQATFGTSSNLNATTASFVLPKSTSTSVFGATSATTSEGFATTNSMPIFSNPTSASSSATPSTASMPVFGATGSAASAITTGAKKPAPGNLFAAANLTTSSSTFPATTNIFGQSTSSTGANFRSTTGVFGTNSGSTLFSAQPTTSSTFSAANVTSNSTVPAFGSTNVTASPASVPAFGAAATSASAFGLQNQNKENSSQSSGAQAFGVGSSIFGGENTAVPVFGASSSTVGPFNVTAAQNTFTGQNAASSSTSTFGGAPSGTANGPAVFGDSSKISPFGTQPSAFGAPNVTVPAFGASTATNENNNSAGIFTFGASQKPPQQTTGAFSFTGTNNPGSNAVASTSAPFQFGSTTSNSVAGFNFSAPSTTPSINFGTTTAGATFTPSTAGMFSIGSGSTAPRSRNIRIRKLR